jgi:uncharacterized membrane protein (DUF485 family)
MPHASGSDLDRARPEAQDGRIDRVDWTRIERSREFRELTSRRHRFLAAASAVTFGTFIVYLGLATFATDFMGTTVLGGVPVAWLAAMTQVLMTWVVTWAYLRKADREFAPLEQRVADSAGARFTREDDGAGTPGPSPDGGASAPATTATTERSTR